MQYMNNKSYTFSSKAWIKSHSSAQLWMVYWVWLTLAERLLFFVSAFSATRLAYCCTTSGVELRLLQRNEHMASVRPPSSWATFAHGMEPPICTCIYMYVYMCKDRHNLSIFVFKVYNHCTRIHSFKRESHLHVHVAALALDKALPPLT